MVNTTDFAMGGWGLIPGQDHGICPACFRQSPFCYSPTSGMRDISANNYSLSVQTSTNWNSQLETTEVQRGYGQGKSGHQIRGEISLLRDWVPSHKNTSPDGLNTRSDDLRLKIRTKLENWSRYRLIFEDRGCECSTATGNITLDTKGNQAVSQEWVRHRLSDSQRQTLQQ